MTSLRLEEARRQVGIAQIAVRLACVCLRADDVDAHDACEAASEDLRRAEERLAKLLNGEKKP